MMKQAFPRTTPILTTLLATLLLVAGCSSEPSESVAVGSPLPSFELPRLEGGTLADHELRGRSTLLAFWATWCQPCLREIPLLRELHEDPRVELVTIALDEGGAGTVAPFAERRGLDYPILLGDQKTFQRLGGFTIPYTLLIDEQGRVAEIYRGLLDRDRVEEKLSGAAR